MFVRAEIALPLERKAVWIPKKALIQSSGQEGAVFVVKDGLAMVRRVVIGEAKQDTVHVNSGLASGDLVVVEGHDKIGDMDEVSVDVLRDSAN
jgi:membrane fusion protein (multidrug efflux system)